MQIISSIHADHRSDGTRIDASGLDTDYDETFFANDGLRNLASWLQNNEAKAPRIPASVRLGCPICRPSKIVCIGLNYRDHAAETKAEPPKEPVLFFKATTSLVGPNDPLVRPKNATKVDWEVELAVVIGKTSSMFPGKRRWIMSRVLFCTTTIPSAIVSWSAAANG